MFKRLFFAWTIIVLTTIKSHAIPRDILRDSVTKATVEVNTRLHSTGYYPYTGSLINRHPTADINLFYERKTLGFFLFYSRDLIEKHSIVNYLQPGIFATLKVNPSLRTRIYFGYLLSQANGFRDTDSDFYTSMAQYWNLGKGFRVENTALLYDWNLNLKVADRLLFVYQTKPVKIEFFIWYRKVLESSEHATSAMVAFTSPRLALSKSFTLLFTGAYQQYLSQYRPSYALKNGFVFTIAAPFSNQK